MIISSYSIAFNCQVENTKLTVPLIADVEIHHSQTYYVIRNFRAGRDYKKSVLPDLTIKKKNGRWVHVDSGKESFMSMQVGMAIDARENGS